MLSADEAGKTIIGLIVAAIGGAVGWLHRVVTRNRESVIKLEERVRNLEEDQLTKEDIRDVISDVLNKRDAVNAERRREQDDAAAAKLEAAVMKGVHECQLQTKQELESIVPRIVRETVQQTRRHSRPEE